MRTIKFRGKRVDNEEWVYGWYAKGLFDLANGVVEIDTIITRIGGYEVIPESVGQWTGLVDLHGKEIYEGDIVGFEDATETEGGSYEQNCIGVVEWGEETASFEVTNRLSAESWEVLCECAVIGNLIDSPELMEV